MLGIVKSETVTDENVQKEINGIVNSEIVKVTDESVQKERNRISTQKC